MTDTSNARLIGTALIVSEDAVATRQLAEALQEPALSVEVCNKVPDAMDRAPTHSKLEVVVIDFSLGNLSYPSFSKYVAPLRIELRSTFCNHREAAQRPHMPSKRIRALLSKNR